MKIFYTRLEDKDVENLSRVQIKNLQTEIGRYIVDYVGKNIYKITDRSIIIEKNKPKFSHSDINFSISHSNRLVVVGFDEYPLGLDVEFMKDRDFSKLSRHYDIKTNDKTEFYKKWTQLEARIKLHSDEEQLHSEIIESDYMMTVVSSNPNKFDVLEINFLSLENLIKVC